MLRRLIATAMLATIPLVGWAEPPTGSTWKMTFSDEFNGNSLDAKKWTSALPWGWNGESGGNGSNGELQSYLPKAVTVSNGFLNLTAYKQANSLHGYNWQYYSGMVQSYNKFSQTYGYYEARIKFPAGKGLWGAFWTLPNDPAFPWPDKGELDFIEFIGNQKNIAHFNRHYRNASGQPDNDGEPFKAGVDFSTDYHIIGADWQPDKIDYYIDGKKVLTITGNMPSGPMYVIFNQAVGGGWPGNPDSTTRFPAVMSVDWIRIYQRVPGGSEPSTPTTPASLQVNCSGVAKEGAFSLNCTGVK